jgi:hypothetical protein
MGEGLAKRIERTGANVAEHHAHGADREGRETALAPSPALRVDEKFVRTGLEAAGGGRIAALAWRSG